MQSSADGILLKDDRGMAVFVFGVTKPADGLVGYATGCLFVKTDGGAGTALYVNEGTHLSADFDAASVA